VTCRSDATPEFSAGRHPRISSLVGGILGGLGALVVAGIGVLISIIITIVVAIRRGNHRRRLLYY